MIRAGNRVLYKDGNSSWLVGIVHKGNAEVNEQGIWIPIVPIQFSEMEPDEVPYLQYAEINQLFTDSVKLDEWMKDYPEYYMTKEQYVQFIKSEEFDKRLEDAYFTDGDYVYYPVSKFNESWIMKQPFEHIARFDK